MIYLSIDVEASGPFPGLFSLVSIGAVPVERRKGVWTVDTDQGYYVEMQPLEGAGELPEATNIHGLTTEYLMANAMPPGQAIDEFIAYFRKLQKRHKKVVPAAWPSSFDSPFVGWYAQYFLGENPIGWSAFDIPSYGMGVFRCARTALRHQMKKVGIEAGNNPNQHHALADAVEQGNTLASLLNHAARLKSRKE